MEIDCTTFKLTKPKKDKDHLKRITTVRQDLWGEGFREGIGVYGARGVEPWGDELPVDAAGPIGEWITDTHPILD